MAAKKTKLKRLARGARNFTRARLYRTDDHLLLVEGHYVEEYRRFFYRDLQAALWTIDRAALWGMGICFLVLSVGSLLLFSGGDAWRLGMGTFLSIPAVMILLRLVCVLACGGYCKFYLCTAAQQTLIPGVRTRRHARKIIKVLERYVDGPA